MGINREKHKKSYGYSSKLLFVEPNKLVVSQGQVCNNPLEQEGGGKYYLFLFVFVLFLFFLYYFVYYSQHIWCQRNKVRFKEPVLPLCNVARDAYQYLATYKMDSHNQTELLSRKTSNGNHLRLECIRQTLTMRHLKIQVRQELE